MIQVLLDSRQQPFLDPPRGQRLEALPGVRILELIPPRLEHDEKVDLRLLAAELRPVLHPRLDLRKVAVVLKVAQVRRERGVVQDHAAGLDHAGTASNRSPIAFRFWRVIAAFFAWCSAS